MNEQVYEKVKCALAEALGVDEGDIQPDSTLVGDLGAESIDFLDILFRLEKLFDVKIPRNELFPEDIFTDARCVQDGHITDQGMIELQRRMPFANLDRLGANPLIQEFGNMLTVADICRFVESKVQSSTVTVHALGSNKGSE